MGAWSQARVAALDEATKEKLEEFLEAGHRSYRGRIDIVAVIARAHCCQYSVLFAAGW